jgi:hypothetical protein
MITPLWLDAYGSQFDPTPMIEAWRLGDDGQAANILWERLYHQGDVGTASYAATPALVRLMGELAEPDWNGYALIASIEEGRLSGGPPIPVELEDSYADAWLRIFPLALEQLAKAADDLLVRSLFAVTALAKNQRSLAALALCTEDEQREMLGIAD